MVEKDIEKMAEELENITKMREELKKISEEGNISEESKEMMHVFVAGLHMNNYSFKNVLIASNAFSTFLALWNNEKMRKLILKTVEEDIIGWLKGQGFSCPNLLKGENYEYILKFN